MDANLTIIEHYVSKPDSNTKVWDEIGLLISLIRRRSFLHAPHTNVDVQCGSLFTHIIRGTAAGMYTQFRAVNLH